MPELYAKLKTAKSVLLVIPSDKDFAAIYVAAAIVKALSSNPSHNQSKFYLLNDYLSQDIALQKDLSSVQYHNLHTKSFRLYSVTLDKRARQISEVYTDDTSDKFVFSFESDQHNIDVSKLMSIKPPLIDFDTILQLGTQNIVTQTKYKQIVEKLGQGSEFYLTHNFLALEASVMFEEMGYHLDSVLVNKSISEAATPEEMLNNHSVLNYLMQSTNDIYGIREAITSSQKINANDYRIINLADNSYTPLEDNIYCAVIDDKADSLTLPRYMHCKFFDLDNAQMAFVIINRSEYSQIYLNMRNESYKTKVLASHNAEIIKDCIVFRSSKSVEFIQQNLVSLLHQFNTLQIQPDELETIPIIQNTPSVQPTPPIEPVTQKFTQGLNAQDPLSPAATIAEPDALSSTVEVSDKPNLPVIEEC